MGEERNSYMAVFLVYWYLIFCSWRMRNPQTQMLALLFLHNVTNLTSNHQLVAFFVLLIQTASLLFKRITKRLGFPIFFFFFLFSYSAILLFRHFTSTNQWGNVNER
jgi:hypothetical protein